jgi:hypothetical protein
MNMLTTYSSRAKLLLRIRDFEPSMLCLHAKPPTMHLKYAKLSHLHVESLDFYRSYGLISFQST